MNVDFRWAKVSSAANGGTDSWQLFYQTNSSATGIPSRLAERRHDVHVQFERRIDSAALQHDAAKPDRERRLARQRPAPVRQQRSHPIRLVQRNGASQRNCSRTASPPANCNRSRSTARAASSARSRTARPFPWRRSPLATFNGADALQPLNGGAYAATADSGPPIYGATGTIVGSSLEASNVDISTQFSQLIVAQQAYSANAKVMSTADQMIQSLLQVIP